MSEPKPTTKCVRIIVQVMNCGEAVNVPNARAEVTFRTFDYYDDELASLLARKPYGGASVIGAELMNKTFGQSEADVAKVVQP